MDHAPHDVVATEGGVTAALVHDHEAATAALDFLDSCEDTVGAPLVDEAERDRLRELAATDEGAPHWHSVLATRDGHAVGYGGLTVPGGQEAGAATGDVAVQRGRAWSDVAVAAVVEAQALLARDHGADRLELWVRSADVETVAILTNSGFGVDRRLAVLGRPLSELGEVGAPEGISIRGFQERDAHEIVEVLAAAYEDTAEAGWDRQRFDDKRELPWFDPADLLVAEEGGKLLGIHWTKRRDAATGEVYNLAIHPEAQGRGLGGALLRAGLRHLAEQGCGRVILWVDMANERGVQLYERHGFTLQWEDLALSRPLA
ncbi:MAG: GNAT family N-acetyltransferase [Nitriliruptorales bacterium]|nr:GNAT family N-acetyltransferase [Nitriliruptorales bacterium]